jgi:hypothetical protein
MSLLRLAHLPEWQFAFYPLVSIDSFVVEVSALVGIFFERLRSWQRSGPFVKRGKFP